MKPVLFFLCSFFASVFSFSQAGFLDESFGKNGRVYTDVLGECFAAAIQPDGKILAGGYSGIYNYMLIRYLPDGALDTSFGQGGIVSLANLSSLEDIHVLEDGKIITAGTSHLKVAAAQFKPDGSLDSLFGDNGTVILDFGSLEGAHALQVQNDGKIILAGGTRKSIEDSRYRLMIRLNGDGSLDKSFGDSGRVVSSRGGIDCLALQDDGKIVAGGEFFNGDFLFSVSRYNTDGSPDESFGINGTVITDISDADDYLYALSILMDGKIVVAGEADYDVGNNPSYMAVVKYNTDGTLDNSFGENGISKIIFEDSSSYATGLLVQSDGKLILAGSAYPLHGNNNFALARLNSDGRLDSSFGINGKVISDFGGSEFANASVLQPDGKIILAGEDHIDYDFLLARYNGDQIEKPWFAKIRKWLHRHGFTWDDWPFNKIKSYTVERSADGIHFNEIARIVNTANQSNLSYKDNAPLSGDNYYRVRAESIDGSVTYSNVIEINENTISIHLYPNPVKDILNIKGLDAGMSYELSVMSLKGSLVAKTSVNNTSSYKWNLRSLSKGVYYLQAESGKLKAESKKTTVKFVKE